METKINLGSKVIRNSHSLDDVRSNLTNMRSDGLRKGAWLGFSHLDELWTLKRGSTTYLVAPPHVGKSSFINEIVDNLIKYSGYKVVIFSPETGSPEDVFNELIWTHCKKPFIKNKAGIYASDADVEEAFRMFGSNIRVLDFGLKDVTINMIYEEVTRLREEEGFDADLLIVDPMAEVKTASSSGVRDDIAIGDVLNKVRRYSSKYDIHTILAVHTVNIGLQTFKDANGSEVRVSPKAKMSEIAGGQMYARKGMMIIILWRPPANCERKDGSGELYRENETIVIVEKAKPKSAGRRGEISLFYDKLSNRYYEIDEQYPDKKIFSYDCPDGFSEREVSPNCIEGQIYEKRKKLAKAEQQINFEDGEEKTGTDSLPF